MSCALLGSPGKCSVEPIGVDLRGECGPALSCLGTCDGAGACTGAGKGTMCSRNRCIGPSAGVGPAYCKAPGARCPTDEAVPFDCAPFICEPAFGACLAGCARSADCANGFTCDVGSRTCVALPPPEEDSGCAMGRSGARGWLAVLLVLVGLGRSRRVTHGRAR